MKATDLMIGDFVLCNELPLRVGAIRQDEIGFFDNDYKIYWCSDDEFDRIDPIPLTENILVKNGFVKTWNSDWQLKEYATIIISKDYYVKVFERSIRIDYVHELQHMLRLVGVDKEIEL